MLFYKHNETKHINRKTFVSAWRQNMLMFIKKPFFTNISCAIFAKYVENVFDFHNCQCLRENFIINLTSHA